MTDEQELTALAKNLSEAPLNQGRPHYERDLANGYLALLAERNALKAHVKPLGEEMIRALYLMNREQLLDWIQEAA
jgi:hypothetical protein